MVCIRDPFESFFSDRFHAVGAAFSPIESGVRRAVKDLESRLLEIEFRKNSPSGVVSATGERNTASDGGVKIEQWREGREGLCANFPRIEISWPILADKFPFRSIKWCFQSSESSHSKIRRREAKCEFELVSPGISKSSDSNKFEGFWLERNLCLARETVVQIVKKLDERSKGCGGERDDLSAAYEPLPSHVDLLKITKGVIRCKKADFEGFLSNIRFARVGLLSGLSGANSSTKDEGEVCSTSDRKEEPKGGLFQPKKWNAFISIPLSNVERLKSILSTVYVGVLVELFPQLGRTSKDHPDKKKLFSVQDFFRYTELEGRRFFEELDRDRDGYVTLEDLEIAMIKRRLPKRYALEFFRRTRRHLFSKSIGWKQFLSIMEQREPTILRAYTTLCLSKSGTLRRNQILTSLKSAGLPANEDNAVAMIRYLIADKGGSISYCHFRNFMLLLPPERLQDDPRNIWLEAATVFPVSPPVELATENVLKSALAGGLACSIYTSMMHPLETMKANIFAHTLSLSIPVAIISFCFCCTY